METPIPRTTSISKVASSTSPLFSRTNKQQRRADTSRPLKDRPYSAIFFFLKLQTSHHKSNQIYVSFIGGGWIIYRFTHSSRTRKFGDDHSSNREARRNRESRYGRAKITPFQVQGQREVNPP